MCCLDLIELLRRHSPARWSIDDSSTTTYPLAYALVASAGMVARSPGEGQ